MECKYFFTGTYYIENIIKIETYWNVNTYKTIYNSKKEMIKIETYWNVNVAEFCPAGDFSKLK